jgi:hypothetical protein
MAMKPARARLLGVGRESRPRDCRAPRRPADQLRHFARSFLDMRRHEVDHALKPEPAIRAAESGALIAMRLEEPGAAFSSDIPPARAIAASLRPLEEPQSRAEGRP